MTRQFTALLVLAIATSMFTTGYCENSSSQVKTVPRIIKPNVSTVLKTKSNQQNADKPVVATKSLQQATVTAIKPPTASKNFLDKPPIPIKYMQVPNPQSFQALVKKDYHLSMPTTFGSNPLASLPGTDGPMVIRVQNNTLFMAINVIDPLDTTSFNSTQSLPEFEQKKPIIQWVFGTEGQLKCQASEYNGFYGDAIIVEGKQFANGKTYELLFSFPKSHTFEYLPTVLYSLNSFKPNK